ncbi:MAG TPA: TIR domain-containing protein [Nitrospira sp.]|nr:TIR domain-containing protein [Nitrospira sp.]
MARRVFFSFHYDRDIRRVVQIRKSWVVRANGEAQPFCDSAEWEAIKRTGIEKWIEEQLAGTSVTVVLIGAETYYREWVLHEIKRSYELKKGILGVYIHNVKDPQTGTDVQGKNPLDYWTIKRNDRSVPFSQIYKTYDWVKDDGYNNFANWVDDAASAVGR